MQVLARVQLLFLPYFLFEISDSAAQDKQLAVGDGGCRASKVDEAYQFIDAWPRQAGLLAQALAKIFISQVGCRLVKTVA